jgi:beta-lactamase regulating signal transducer with metallopeptidase domain
MLTWFLVNVVLSVLALVFITLNDTAPHRLRFFAGFTALAAWLVPWPLLPDLLPANMFSFQLWRMEQVVEVTSTRLTGVIPVIVATGAQSAAPHFIVLTVVELAFLALTLVGCLLFAWKLIAHRVLLRRLERKGGDGNWLWARAGLAPVCPVGVQRDIAGAFSSGLIKPRIWVHGDLVHSPQLETLLRHEVTHIRQHDNWYLLVITFVERVFWWNPLVWYLGRGTRDLQELSCDELCQRSNSDYPAQLAQLMIDAARGAQPRMLALGANIFNNPNPNVKRIQLLQRSYPMLKKHILGAAVTAASAFLAVGFVTAQPETRAVAGERVEVFKLERAPGAEDDVLFVTDEAGVEHRVRTVHRGVAMAGPGSADQFIRIDANNGEELISLSFNDVPLTTVLMPLVGFVSHRAMGIAGVPSYADTVMVHALDESAEEIYGMAPEEVVETVKAEGGTASWAEDGRVMTFSATRVGPDGGPGSTGPFNRALFTAGPPSENLVLEYPEAANKIVSVTVADATIEEAIAAIAGASGCNIFQDGETIVVDYCDE